MKQKMLMLAISLLGFVAAKADSGDPEPGRGNGKKDDLNGIVVHAESKKPLKDVSVTAVLISKKEKTVITDEVGSFAFDELKPGTYKFIFEKAGFRKITKEKVVIKTDEAFQLNIEMIENSDYEIMPSPFNIGGIK
ncbi:MAG: carboxypeptidase-like regulatory domain-containing protein [Chitinophagaceae bacterium]